MMRLLLLLAALCAPGHALRPRKTSDGEAPAKTTKGISLRGAKGHTATPKIGDASAAKALDREAAAERKLDQQRQRKLDACLDVLITEVADPPEMPECRFVELYSLQPLDDACPDLLLARSRSNMEGEEVVNLYTHAVHFSAAHQEPDSHFIHVCKNRAAFEACYPCQRCDIENEAYFADFDGNVRVTIHEEASGEPGFIVVDPPDGEQINNFDPNKFTENSRLTKKNVGILGTIIDKYGGLPRDDNPLEGGKFFATVAKAVAKTETVHKLSDEASKGDSIVAGVEGSVGGGNDAFLLNEGNYDNSQELESSALIGGGSSSYVTPDSEYAIGAAFTTWKSRTEFNDYDDDFAQELVAEGGSIIGAAVLNNPETTAGAAGALQEGGAKVYTQYFGPQFIGAGATGAGGAVVAEGENPLPIGPSIDIDAAAAGSFNEATAARSYFGNDEFAINEADAGGSSGVFDSENFGFGGDEGQSDSAINIDGQKLNITRSSLSTAEFEGNQGTATNKNEASASVMYEGDFYGSGAPSELYASAKGSISSTDAVSVKENKTNAVTSAETEFSALGYGDDQVKQSSLARTDAAFVANTTEGEARTNFDASVETLSVSYGDLGNSGVLASLDHESKAGADGTQGGGSGYVKSHATGKDAPYLRSVAGGEVGSIVSQGDSELSDTETKDSAGEYVLKAGQFGDSLKVVAKAELENSVSQATGLVMDGGPDASEILSTVSVENEVTTDDKTVEKETVTKADAYGFKSSYDGIYENGFGYPTYQFFVSQEQAYFGDGRGTKRDFQHGFAARKCEWEQEFRPAAGATVIVGPNPDFDLNEWKVAHKEEDLKDFSPGSWCGKYAPETCQPSGRPSSQPSGVPSGKPTPKPSTATTVVAGDFQITGTCLAEDDISTIVENMFQPVEVLNAVFACEEGGASRRRLQATQPGCPQPIQGQALISYFVEISSTDREDALVLLEQQTKYDIQALFNGVPLPRVFVLCNGLNLTASMPGTKLPPTPSPTGAPSGEPTSMPSKLPTTTPSAHPTVEPTLSPTPSPTASPTATPTAAPTAAPTATPTATPTAAPTEAPTKGCDICAKDQDCFKHEHCDLQSGGSRRALRFGYMRMGCCRR